MALHTESRLTADEALVRDIRKLVIDCCRQNGGGHGGSAIGMAPLGVALWKHTMRFNPANADWFDRDRFVLSNGHAAIFLYTMLHVAGYAHMSLDELKLYASPKKVDPDTGKWKSTICHGHPEIEVPGVEVTTGPLGQGVANAVGLAIASKNLAGTFNKPDHNDKIIQSRVYCVTGDGCLQEGVAVEAMAIAGRLRLDNLVLLYDNNQVTCDGPLDWIVTEDTNRKMEAMGWHVIDVFDGDTNVDNIVAALSLAQSAKDKPTFINIRTTIGFGTSTAGTAKSHHGTYSDADAALYSARSDSATHALSEEAQSYMASTISRGKELEREWQEKLKTYCERYPEERALLKARIAGDYDFTDLLKTMPIPVQEPAPTRQINGFVFNKLMEAIPNLIAGGADLWNSNQMGDQSSRILDASNPAGRVIRYGIREHAMAAISNGLAAYNPGTIVPVTATFFMFYLYAAPGVRMGALSNLKVIHIATHDSIGEGQNGPTHQPVEVDSLYRAMPNMLYIRPSDAEEVIGAWLAGLSVKGHSVIISLARDAPGTKVPNTSRENVSKGGYVVIDHDSTALVTLISCGSELQFAVEAAMELTATGIPTRVVSMPCVALFEKQSIEYKESVLSNTPHCVSVEAYISTIWARYCTASIAMSSFGYSGAGRDNFARFGLDARGIIRKIKAEVEENSNTAPVSRRWKFLA